MKHDKPAKLRADAFCYATLTALKLADNAKISVSYQYNTNGKLMFYNYSPLVVNMNMQAFDNTNVND